MIHRSALVLGILGLLATRSTSQQVESARLAALDEHPGNGFGVVSLSGDLALVGAPDFPRNAGSGAAYVYGRAASGLWKEIARLRGSSSGERSWFGSSVKLLGLRAAVGASGDADRGPSTGSVYLFEQAPHGAWKQVARIMPADAHPYQGFGGVLALGEERLLVGVPSESNDPRRFVRTNRGACYVFDRDAVGAWNQVAKLTASDAADLDLFGRAVALDGERALVGAFREDAGGNGAGAAYVFERAPDGSWTETAKLIAADATVGAGFGGSVSLWGDEALIGALRDDAPDNSSGSAYRFERNAATGAWTQSDKLVASDGAARDCFGKSVSLWEGRAMIGAPHPDAADQQAGTAYVYEAPSSGPSPRSELIGQRRR